MTRTDTHRPSVIEPTEYQFVSFHDHRPEAAVAQIAEQEAFRAHRERTGGKFSDHEHGGVCHVCGNAHALTVARFWHAPTHSYIEVGETCAEKLWNGERVNFASFRAKVAAGVEAAAGKAKAERILTDAGLSFAYDVWLQKDYDNWGREEEIISDIVGKLVRYGSVSDKQVALIAKLIGDIDRKAEIAAQREAEAAAALPIPAAEGRATIEGVVVSRKMVEGYYGNAVKIIVKHDDGWRVYGSEPSSVSANVGDRIRFDAMITVADDDPKFGFFKRPNKAEVVA
jgi:hypothetical protein